MNIKAIRNPDVIATTEDYLWVQLMLLQEDTLPTDGPSERYTLCDFSNRMQQFGLAHFKTTPIWFMVLLLCGEFELAVYELFKDAFFSHDAMHFAIALSYYGLLRVPENPKALPNPGTLVSAKSVNLRSGQTYNVYYFHISKMVTKFVKQWVGTDAPDMFHYLYILGLFGSSQSVDGARPSLGGANGKEYTTFIHSVIRDILRSTNNYAEVLGQVRPDGGGRTPGSVEKYKSLVHLGSEQDYLDIILLGAAVDADRESRYKDAIQLYDLAGQYDKVFELLNRRLGDALLQHTILQDSSVDAYASSKGSNTSMPPIDTDPVDSAQQILDYYQSRPQSAGLLDSKTVKTCSTLISLYQFRLLVNQNRDDAALQVLYSLDILPQSLDMSHIQLKANAFHELEDTIARVMPHVMITATQSLYKLYRAAVDRSNTFEASVRKTQTEAIRQRSKSLLVFAGLIQYRIPGDIFAKMNRIDVMMG